MGAAAEDAVQQLGRLMDQGALPSILLLFSYSSSIHDRCGALT
jgi:hypothetical protein